MMQRALALTLICALGASALPACGSRSETVDPSYAGSARRAFQLGEEALKDEDYEEAIRNFTFVKNKFAYSRYAALAELRIADTYFAQEKWIEAIDAYRVFMQAHPSHREVPYAMWRIGEADYQQLPSDFILFPPAYEKDQAPTREALRNLEAYVQRFPQDEHVAEAKERIRDCRRMLADSELYVARFYMHDHRAVSARGRLEGVVADYEDLPDRWCEAALLLVRAYIQLDMKDEARKLAERITKAHPDRPEAEDARDAVAALN
jgi:outer membrane protein assembly factor BamD